MKQVILAREVGIGPNIETSSGSCANQEGGALQFHPGTGDGLHSRTFLYYQPA